MKIHFIHHSMLPGGVERQLYYLANGLVTSHQVTLMLCERKGEFLDFLDARVKVHDLQTPYRRRLQAGLLMGLLKVLNREQPDVLVSFHGKFHWMVVAAGALAGIRTLCAFPGYLTRGLLAPAHRAILHRADGLVAVSCGVKKSLVENLGIREDRATVIENAIDTGRIMEMSKEPLTPAEAGYFQAGAVIVGVGRLARGKGFEHLIAAMSMVKKDASLVIVGGGPERERLARLIEEMGLSGRVFLLGNQVNPYKFLNKGSLFALASESEGLPTVVLEAMCLGVPCLCTRYRGGTEGIVDHGETGYLVEPGDPEVLAKALDFLLSPQAEPMKEAMVKAGKALVETKFSLNNYVARYSRYLQALAGRSPDAADGRG